MTWKQILLRMRRDGATSMLSLPVGFAARTRSRALLEPSAVTAAVPKAHEPELLAKLPDPQPLRITWASASE